MLPLAAAFSLAEFNAIKLATSYTPSSVRTTLKFRSGMIGSLHDPEFQKLRSAVDDSCFIFGAMVRITRLFPIMYKTKTIAHFGFLF